MKESKNSNTVEGDETDDSNWVSLEHCKQSDILLHPIINHHSLGCHVS